MGFMVFTGWLLDNIFDVSVLTTFSSVMAVLSAHHCFQSLHGIRLVKIVMGTEDLRFWLIWLSEGYGVNRRGELRWCDVVRCDASDASDAIQIILPHLKSWHRDCMTHTN